MGVLSQPTKQAIELTSWKTQFGATADSRAVVILGDGLALSDRKVVCAMTLKGGSTHVRALFVREKRAGWRKGSSARQSLTRKARE